MRRVALLLLGVVAVTGLEFEVFPGHSYLQADSQTYLPMLERLDAPGYLSRDLVATHPDVAYTIYDEVTLFLHEAGRLRFETALEAQQLFCRAAAVTGVLLLALSMGVGDLFALLLAAFVNLGAVLWAPTLVLMDPEPVPRAFAFALMLLAAGLLAHEKPLLAGFAGGTALIYDPVIVAPFWFAAAIAFACDARLRRLLRPALTILVIFILLLANLAQLQPGIVESGALLRTLTAQAAAVQQYRIPEVWVTLWPPGAIWSDLEIYVCGLWATARIWPTLTRTMQWLTLTLPLIGILSIPASYIALDKLRWSIVPQLFPTQALLYTAAFSSLLCGTAGAHAIREGRKGEARLWFLVMFALPVNSRLLDLLRVGNATHLFELGVCVALAAALAYAIPVSGSRWRYAALLIPLVAVLALAKLSQARAGESINAKPVLQLADWAERSTWGSSMFLFPDAGRDLYPGMFRAASRRAVWVDWSSGALVDGVESVTREWWARWNQSMASPFSPERLGEMLALPVDYYVLKKSNRLVDVRPAFENREFVVYDAADLRRAALPLHLAAAHRGA